MKNGLRDPVPFYVKERNGLLLVGKSGYYGQIFIDNQKYS
tara:strand:+ start:117 stop:236 length:120 start_codon:yes stop_codon:yes gene_type:complete